MHRYVRYAHLVLLTVLERATARATSYHNAHSSLAMTKKKAELVYNVDKPRSKSKAFKTLFVSKRDGRSVISSAAVSAELMRRFLVFVF